MGQSQSRHPFAYRSTPQAVVPNLTSALSDEERWEEDAMVVKEVLTGVDSRSRTFDENSALRVIRLVDSVVGGQEKGIGTVTDEDLRSAFMKQPIPAAVSSSKMFAFAAKEMVAEKASSGRGDQGGQYRQLSEQEREAGRTRGGSELATAGLGLSGASTSRDEGLYPSLEQRGAGSKAAEIESKTDERYDIEESSKVLAAKYLYIHDLIRRLVKSAEFCYKLNAKNEYVRKQSKPKRFQELSGAQQSRVLKLQNESQSNLARALVNHDRAKATLAWLYRDWDINFAQFRLHQQIALANQQLASGGSDEQRVNLNRLIKYMKYKIAHLEIAQQDNERQSLALGLHFLDRDFSGGLSVDEVQDMPASLWHTLDPAGKGRIAHEDLQGAIMKLTDELEQHMQEYRHLQDQSQRMSLVRTAAGESQLLANQDRMKELEFEMDKKKTSLRDIYRYFHRSFVQNTFHKLDEDIRAQTIDVNTLATGLDRVERVSRCDPMVEQGYQTRERGVIGPSTGTRATAGAADTTGGAAAPTGLGAGAATGIGAGAGAATGLAAGAAAGRGAKGVGLAAEHEVPLKDYSAREREQATAALAKEQQRAYDTSAREQRPYDTSAKEQQRTYEKEQQRDYEQAQQRPYETEQQRPYEPSAKEEQRPYEKLSKEEQRAFDKQQQRGYDQAQQRAYDTSAQDQRAYDTSAREQRAYEKPTKEEQRAFEKEQPRAYEEQQRAYETVAKDEQRGYGKSLTEQQRAYETEQPRAYGTALPTEYTGASEKQPLQSFAAKEMESVGYLDPAERIGQHMNEGAAKGHPYYTGTAAKQYE